MGLRDFFKKKKAHEVVLPENSVQVVAKSPLWDELLRKNAYIELLEKEIDKLKNEKSKLKNKKTFKLSDAIIEVLGDANSEMNAAQIFQKLHNLGKAKKLKMASVRATLYYLINQKKLRYGLQKCTFTPCVDVQFDNSPWDPR